jgi:hypothetical protein
LVAVAEAALAAVVAAAVTTEAMVFGYAEKILFSVVGNPSSKLVPC